MPDDLPVDEEHPRRPQEAYALSKSLGEDICDALVRRCAATAVSIRPSLVLAPIDYARIGPLQSRREPSFNHWSYVHLEDLAELIVLAATATSTGHEVVHAAQPDNQMGASFADLVSRSFGDDAPPIRPIDRDDAAAYMHRKRTAPLRLGPAPIVKDRLTATV